MPNNEDYLDSLLSDITKVRTDSKKADDDAARERKRRLPTAIVSALEKISWRQMVLITISRSLSDTII